MRSSMATARTLPASFIPSGGERSEGIVYSGTRGSLRMEGIVFERIALRLAFAGMLLLGSCGFVSAGIRESARRLESGSQSIILPAGAAVSAALSLLLGLAMLWRGVAEIRVARKGFTAKAAITRSVQLPNGTWVNDFKFHDRQGLPREGSFLCNLATWRAGDAGEAKWLEDTKYALWITEEGPRGPGVFVPPRPVATAMPPFRRIFIVTWIALLLAAIAAAAYVGWRGYELHPEAASEIAKAGTAAMVMIASGAVLACMIVSALIAGIATACVAMFRFVAMFVRPR